MAKGKIKCVFYIPDGAGEYRRYEELSEREKKSFCDSLAERMNGALSDYFAAHPEELEKVDVNNQNIG